MPRGWNPPCSVWASSVNEFLATGSETSAGAYKVAKQHLDQQITTALGTVKDPARTAQLKEAVTLLAQYDAAFQRVATNTAQMDTSNT